jgi:ribose transport system permease protein
LKLILRQETSLIIVIVAIGIAATIRNPAFSHVSNLTEIASVTVMYWVMDFGAALLMIGGGLDFSVGAIFTLGGVTSSWLLVHGVSWPIAVLLGVGAGTVVGIINDVIIVHLHVPPIIATLGTFFIVSGLVIQLTGGQDIVPLPNGFQNLGQGTVLGVPYIVCYAVVLGIVFWFMLEKTGFGVNVRALGGNRQAAIGNGLHVGRLDFALYILAGATAGFAGIIYSASVGAGQVEAGGATTTLFVITGVLIGGTSMFGGLGTITGVAVGALLLSEINNALIVANIPPQYNSMVVGAILICAVAIDYLRRKRLYRR